MSLLGKKISALVQGISEETEVEPDDYGDQLLNQAPILPANETEFHGIKEPEEPQPNTTEEP